MAKTVDVLKKLQELSFLEGFPQSKEALLAYAQTLATFIHNKPIFQFSGDDIPENVPEGHLLWSLDRSGPLPEDIKTDLDWIIRAIAHSCDKLPSPAKVYMIYERYFPPLNSQFVELAIREAGEE